MLDQMKYLIQDNKQKVNSQKISNEDKLNLLSQRFLKGEITQQQFLVESNQFSKEINSSSNLSESIESLRSVNELLDLGILKQTIKMKTEMLNSLDDNKIDNNIKSNTNTGDECSNLLVFNKSDGNNYIEAKKPLFIINGNDKISLFPILGQSKSSVLIKINVIGKDLCFDEKSKILFSFRDGSRSEIEHNSDDNCNGETILFFGEMFGDTSTKNLNEFKYKEIEKINIWMANKLVNVNLSRLESIRFMNTIDCLTNYMN